MADARTYRFIYLGLGLVLLAVVAAAAALSSGGSSTSIPRPLEQISPAPNSAVVRPTSVVVDLPVGYTLDLEVDGVPIHPTEVRFTPSTGRYQWSPGEGKAIERWEPGTHSVRISWDRTVGLPDQGLFAWSFRVQ